MRKGGSISTEHFILKDFNHSVLTYIHKTIANTCYCSWALLNWKNVSCHLQNQGKLKFSTWMKDLIENLAMKQRLTVYI